MTPTTTQDVQVCMSTEILNRVDTSAFQELERRARILGEAIAEHYSIQGKIVTVEVSSGNSNFGAGKNSEWFRISYLNGKFKGDKNVLRSKHGNFNDYCGMRRLWGKYESGDLASMLR